MANVPSDEAREALQAALASMPPGIVKQDGSLGRGAPLLVIAALRSRGHAMTGSLLDEVSSRLSLSPSRVGVIEAFCDRLLASRDHEARQRVALCRGMTCTLHGADRLHPLFKRVMREAGAAHEYVDVFCLSQCEHGPSIMAGKHIWVTRARNVVTDDREWRQGDSGPVPVGDVSAPVGD